MPHDPHGDAADPRAAQDAAWREIVENYGDRPLIEDDHGDRDSAADETATATQPPALERPQAAPVEEHFVPPPVPPVPWAEPRRLLAWIGMLGVPVIVLLALVARLPVPSWLGVMLMFWFVGGFVFLVASMRPGPRDDNDDGAVV